MREYGGRIYMAHSFLTSALDKSELLISVPAALLREKNPVSIAQEAGWAAKPVSKI
jgi:hypothetical protein